MKIAFSLLLTLIVVSAVWAQATGPGAATTATAPAGTPASGPAVDPAARKVLDLLQAAGVANKTIIANKLVYVVYDPALGDKTTRTGYVKYRRDSEKDFTRFRIHFDTVQINKGDRVIEREDYALAPDNDGTQWMVTANESNKKIIRYQVAQSGQKVEPFEIGKGPFPMPFGQKTENVLKICDATTKAVDPKDPDFERVKNTQYIRLTPKADAKANLNFTILEMWVDPKTGLPVKIVSTEKNKRSTTVTFDDIKLNQKIDEVVFKIPRPAGWTVEVKPLK